MIDQLEQQRADLQAVMDLPAGRRLLWRLLGQAGAFRAVFVAGSPDVTAFNAGAQNFALSLLGEIMTDTPSGFLTMQQEAMADEHHRKQTKQALDLERRRDSDDGRTSDGYTTAH